MRTRSAWFLTTAALAVFVSHSGPAVLRAQTSTAAALTGQVSSTEEGAMEGVLVSAKREGSTITITVVTDQQGRYQFPRARLEPGSYALRIQAAGYDLAGPDTVRIGPQKTTTADLKLRKAKDLASQLSNTEWLMSLPGTDAQKASIRGCGHCHNLAVPLRSSYDAAAFMPVLERMENLPETATDAQAVIGGSTENAPTSQLGPPAPGQQLRANLLAQRQKNLETARRQQAEYLASVNLSAAPQYKYDLKTLPRPKGQATQVIYTEFDLSPRTRQPHDVIADSQGMVWYASFGEQILGRLDPRTGKITEYKVPVLKPDAPAGSLAVGFDRDENIWLGMLYQGGIAKFDRKTETFQTWKLPPELDGPSVRIDHVDAAHHHVDGKVWFQDAGTYRLFRLDLASSQTEVFEPYPIPRRAIFDVVSDAGNNAYFTVPGRERIGRIDAKTKEIKLFPTPTKGSGARRGMVDQQGRFWFAENSADKIGMFDTKTERFQEWAPPMPGAWPSDVTADKNGEAWIGGEYNGRILRLDPGTSRFVEYLLPRFPSVRRVFVDNQTTPVTFWAGNIHEGSIIRLEPLDAVTRETSRR